MTPRTGAALLVTAALLLTGCSGGDDDAVEPTQRPASSAEPSADPSSEGELPAGFPADEVPLVDGEVGEVLENAAPGLLPGQDLPRHRLRGRVRATRRRSWSVPGFEQGPDVISAGPTSSTADFTSPDWFVVITGGLPDRTMVQYTIYPNE